VGNSKDPSRKRLSKYWRKFGIEFESSTPYDETLLIAKDAFKKVYGKLSKLHASNSRYKSNSKSRWDLKAEVSTECELTTPISTIDDLPKICQLAAELQKAGIKTTRNDGVHIHMQAGKYKGSFRRYKIILAWLQIEITMRKCFPRHRCFNFQCESINRAMVRYVDRRVIRNKIFRIKSIFDTANDNADEHQSDLSLEYYDDRGTVEFRLCEGTFDPYIIRNWVKFYMHFLNYAESMRRVDFDALYEHGKANDVRSIEDVAELLKITNKELIQFLKDRYTKYSPRSRNHKRAITAQNAP
jgi:hypothetical protein